MALLWLVELLLLNDMLLLLLVVMASVFCVVMCCSCGPRSFGVPVTSLLPVQLLLLLSPLPLLWSTWLALSGVAAAPPLLLLVLLVLFATPCFCPFP